MKSMNAILVLSVAMLFVHHVYGDDSMTTHVANAKSFSIEGVKLGMTIDDFKKLFPAAEPLSDLSDTVNNKQGFRVDSTANTDGIDAAFFEGKLFDCYVWYMPSRLNKMGGDETILNKLVEKFGKANADSKGYDGENSKLELHWRIPEADFYCSFMATPNKSTMNITDTAAFKKFMELKAKKANVGF